MAGPSIQRMADTLRAEEGTIEGPRNNETKYGAWYGFNFVAWCAILQSWASAKAGAMYLGKPWRFASTIASRDHARANGRWSGTPRVGTIAMKSYTGSTGHVGFVVGIQKDGGIITREGNTSGGSSGSQRDGGGVHLRVRYGFWSGYIVLDETDGSGPAQPPPPPYQPPAPGKILVDGGFGPATVTALQRALNDRHGANPRLAADGDFGPATKRALQAMLDHLHGPVAIDGDFGPRSIKALQHHVGATADGEWGPNTTRAIQTKLNDSTF